MNLGKGNVTKGHSVPFWLDFIKMEFHSEDGL